MGGERLNLNVMTQSLGFKEFRVRADASAVAAGLARRADPPASEQAFRSLLSQANSAGRGLHTHISTSCLIVNDRGAERQYGLVLHRKRHEWFYPGGHADGEWNWLRGAWKECQEETGAAGVRVRFRLEDQLPTKGEEPEVVLLPHAAYLHNVSRDPAGDHDHWDFVYVFRVDEPQALRIDPNESLALGWLGASEVAHLRGAGEPEHIWHGAPLSARTLDVLHRCEADWASCNQEVRLPRALV